MSIEERIIEWFKHGGHELEDRISAMVAEMPRPLPEFAAAWEDWMAYEREHVGYNFYTAMDMCKFAEWSAMKALRLTNEPFSGIPRIVICIAQTACNSLAFT